MIGVMAPKQEHTSIWLDVHFKIRLTVVAINDHWHGPASITMLGLPLDSDVYWIPSGCRPRQPCTLATISRKAKGLIVSHTKNRDFSPQFQ